MVRALDTSQVWQLLDEIHDPELPALSIRELGMVRSVGVDGRAVKVTLTPTFLGCPALDLIQSLVKERLKQAGAEPVEVNWSLSPPWSTDWVTDEGRQKLIEFGLAPPPRHGGAVEAALLEPVQCPYCESENTVLKNSFGPALCRALYVCSNCRQPFEQFKPI